MTKYGAVPVRMEQNDPGFDPTHAVFIPFDGWTSRPKRQDSGASGFKQASRKCRSRLSHSAGALSLLLGLCISGALPSQLVAQSANFVGVQSTVVTGLNQPLGVAVDKAGNVFVANGSEDFYVELPAGGGQEFPTFFEGYPLTIAVDNAGNLYVGTASTVVKIPADGSPQTTVGTFDFVNGIAVDAAGDVYVSDSTSVASSVMKVPAGGGTPVPVDSMVDDPAGLAVDSAGDLFIADYVQNVVIKIPFGGGASTTVGTGLSGPSGVAFDAIGNLFIVDSKNDRVVEVPVGGGSQITVPVTGLNAPWGIAVDSTGDMFIADQGNNRVVEFQTRTASFGGVNVCPAGQLTPTPCNQTLALDVELLTPIEGPSINFTARLLTDGASNQDFVLSSTVCQTYIKTPRYCNYNVTFAPMYSGQRKGALQILDGSTVLLTVPLYGLGNAPQIAFDSAAQTTIPATGLNNPSAVATDGAGDVFIVDTYNNRVVEMPAGGGAQFNVNTEGAELSNPLGVAVDGAGDLFIADYGNQRVVKIPFGGGAFTVLGLGLSPAGIAVDAMGDVFIPDYPNNQVVEVPIGGGPQRTVANASNSVRGPRGIAVDASGNVYIASSDNALVLEVPLSGAPITAVGTGLSAPYGVAVDAAGTVYIADYGATSIIDVPPSYFDLPQYTLGSGLTNPTGLAVDAAGNLIVADYGVGRVLEWTRSQPPALNFAATQVGSLSSDSPQTVRVQNIGNNGTSELNLSNVCPPTDFLVASADLTYCSSSPSSINLPNGQWFDLPVEFLPQSEGQHTESLTFTSNTLNSNSAAQSIAVSGTGLAAKVSLSATTLSFGSEEIGVASGSKSVTLTNTGNEVLDITSIAVTGADASSWVFANSCGTTLAVGANCSIHGHFAPVASGALTATIIITDNAIGSTQSIALSGTGAGPAIKLSATHLAFGVETVGTAGGSQSVTMTNTGNAALTIASITVTGADASSWVFANTCGATLAAGANCSIHGHFAPVTGGALTATISITDNAAGSPQTIALSGTGTGPAVKLSATSLSFGSEKVGSASASQSVTATNTGNQALSITSIAITGTNASSFVFANTCGATLAAGAECTIHGHFAPTITGALTATVTITDNAGGSPHSIALSGTGQ